MTTFSNRQYPMLQAFIDAPRGHHMTKEEAMAYDQRPFRSMLIRKYIDYDAAGFFLTELGRRAWEDFRTTDISRKNSRMPLTAYFDERMYLSRARRRAKVHVISKVA